MGGGPASYPPLALTIMYYRFAHQPCLVSPWQARKGLKDFEMGPAIFISTHKFVISIGL